MGAAAVAATELVGSPVEVGFTRLQAGFLQPVAGNVQAADEIAAHELAQAEALGSPPMAAAAHWLCSLVALFRENVPTALARLQDTLAAVERVAPDAPPFLPAVSMAVVLVP